MKSWSNNKKVILRNPLSTRPWQHVLEAIGGYLIFGAKLRSNSKIKGEVFNFGPNYNYSHSVIDLVREMKKSWNKVSWVFNKKKDLKKYYESNLLRLNCSKAKKILKWSTILTFKETSKLTSLWYKKFYSNKKHKNILKRSTKFLPKSNERKIMKVLILAGGKGTRLSEITKLIPKPMIKIVKKPIIVRIINHYVKYGYKDFIIAGG